MTQTAMDDINHQRFYFRNHFNVLFHNSQIILIKPLATSGYIVIYGVIMNIIKEMDCYCEMNCKLVSIIVKMSNDGTSVTV